MKTLLPKLRFPDFQDEWEEKHLIDVADKKVKWSFIGGPFGSNLKASDYTASGIRIIQLQNIGDGEFIDDYKIFTSEQKADELLSCNIYPGEIILSKMGDPVARACLIPDNHQRYVMCSDGIRLVVDEKKYDKLFIYSYINSADFRRNAEKAATGSTRKRVGLDNLKDLPVFVPEFAEQQKIADCLTSLDELITAQIQKVEALHAYKKGLMQNLFPAEGESVPRLRFPEFESAGEWEEKTLGEVCERIMDGTHFSPKSKSGSRMYLTSKNIKNGIIDLSNVSYISEEEHRQIYDKCPVRKNDVLLTKDGANTGNCAINNIDVEFSLLSSVAVLRGNPLLIDHRFLYQTILSDRTQNLIQDSISGQAITRITLEKIEKFSVYITTTEEQQRIAELLTAIDEQIAAQGETVEMLKSHKKGLMQGLFPSVEEG